MNSEELNSAWKNVCDQVIEYDAIDSSQMNAFFSRLQPQAMSDGFLMLTADNDFIKTWIEKHYTRYIKQALRDVYGMDYTVAIEVDINQEVPTQTEQPVEQEKPVAEPAAKKTAPKEAKPSPADDFQETAREDRYEDNQLSPTSTLTFENFVIGESNRMA